MENNNIPKIRFKEFDSMWEGNKISDIVKISAGGDIDMLGQLKGTTPEADAELKAFLEAFKG